MSLVPKMTDMIPISGSSDTQWAKWLRYIGCAVLLLGIIGGAEIYRSGTSSPDLMDDPEMLGFDRAERRQMGLMYGTQGKMILELEDALSRPQNQAFILLVASALMAGGCWYFASLLGSKRD